MGEPYLSQALRGAAALNDMLECIGADSASDKAVAKLLVDNELVLCALLSFALQHTALEK
jgi:hypothetical protein